MKKKDYILSLIAEGEHVHQDFKYQISDARKIARSISAFANNSGGRLLIGVKDNGNIAGVKSDEEIYMIEQAATMYCKPEQSVEFSIYSIEGKSVLKVDIPEASVKPVKAQDDNGRWCTYYRVKDENIMATSTHVKVLMQSHNENGTTVSFTEREKQLLNYLRDHGGITTNSVNKLLHCSQQAADEMLVSLCNVGITQISYHDGCCVVTLTE